MYEVKVLPEAEKVIKKWKKSNPQLFKKYQKIFHELADHPRTGIGHPEALKGGNDVTYSRHITPTTVSSMISMTVHWSC